MSDELGSAVRTLTRRGAATRSRIVDAAAKLIYEYGVDRTSLDDVMAAARVSKSQLYHYFVDKDELVLEVIALQTKRVLNAQQPYLGSLDSMSALRSWRDLIIRLNEGAESKGCPLGSLANELANDSKAARTNLVVSFAMWSDAIEQGLGKMKMRGELSASMNTKDVAVAILSALQGGLLLAKTSRSSRPLQVAMDMAIEHVARYSTNERERD